MSKMSYCFRDLENVSEDQRKSAILLALVARIDELQEPNPTEARKISELFVPLFDTAPLDTKRQVASALSRSTFVPTKVTECICLQALEISAPFLSHSPSVTNAILRYVIAKKSEYHARMIAKRKDLHRTVVRSLEALDDHGVNLTLQLRGYKSDNAIHIENAQTRISLTEPAVNASIQTGELELFTGEAELFPEKMMGIMARRLEAKALAMKQQLLGSSSTAQSAQISLQQTTQDRAAIDTQSHDRERITDKQFAAEEHLRQTLRNLASGELMPNEAEALLAAQIEKTDNNINENDILIPINQNDKQHRNHMKLLTKHANNNHIGYFTSALADAIGSSYALAERIMSDMTGQQLAMSLSAIRAPEDMSIDVLNKFFPHVSIMEGTIEGAAAMARNIQQGPSEEKLITWLRADSLTRETGVPELYLTDADIAYSPIDVSDLPYTKPVADNADLAPAWGQDGLENGKLNVIND